MKRFISKKIWSLVLTIVVMTALSLTPSESVQAEASYMHKLKVPFGMELRKNYTLTIKYAEGIKKKKVDYSLWDVKKTKKGSKTRVKLGIMYWFQDDFSTNEVDVFYEVFFASPFCRKLQNKNVGCCKRVL